MNAIRSILVHLDGTARAEVRLRLAHQFAAIHQARLTALFGVAPAYLPLMPLAGGMPLPPPPAGVDPDHRASALALFEKTRDAGAPSSEWREPAHGATVVETVVRHALLSDLMVLGQRDPADAKGFDVPGELVESVLIDSGKPALVVPYVGAVTAEPRTVLVAWKPTRESARALTASLPFLRAAKAVHLVRANDSDGRGPAAHAEPAQYLRLHGIEQVREHGALTDSDAGNALLSLAADVGAEMLVMGCYGHSRVRELVLGGASRVVLDSMTLPVLMAH